MMITKLTNTDNQRQRVFGSRVRDARMLEQKTAKSVAAALGISSSRYSQIEDAEEGTTLDSDVLQRLSQALNFDEEFFASRPEVFIDRRALCFRAKKDMSKRQIEQVAGWARLAGELVVDTQDRGGTVIPLNLPEIDDGTSPEQAATLFRQHRGLAPNEPIEHLARELEKSGIYIVAANFTDDDNPKHDAVSTWFGRHLEHPLILMRAIDSWERTRLSLAHEAGHLILHRSRQPETREEEAFAFASELLLPAMQLQREWPTRTSLQTLLPLKARWGVSLAALIMRGGTLGRISVEQRRSLFKQLSTRRSGHAGLTWRQREPGAHDRAVEKPIFVARMIELAYRGEVDVDTLRRIVHSYPARYIEPILAGQAPITEELNRAVPKTAGNVASLSAHARGN